MDNCNIKIKVEGKKITITGLEFTFMDRLKFLFLNKKTKIVFTNSKIVYNGVEQ